MESTVFGAVLDASLKWAAKNRVATAGGVSLGVLAGYLLKKNRDGIEKLRERQNRESTKKNKSRKRKGRARINKEFFGNLRKLLKIVVPRAICKESSFLLSLTCFLVARTYLSIKISEVNGGIVRALVNTQWKEFIYKIVTLGCIAVPASTVNSMLKFLNQQIALCFRSRLVWYFQNKYLAPMMYYKVVNLDSRIKHPDQALTETIDKWGKCLADLYQNMTKPMLDIVLFTVRLADLVGPRGPLTIMGYYACAAVLKKFISPKFGMLTRQSQILEGDFRNTHNRIITFSEEIAFYGGHEREKASLTENYDAIRSHRHVIMGKKFWMGIYRGFLEKYGPVLIGYAILGLPVFGPGREAYLKSVDNDASRITRDYVRNSSLLIDLARAIGRVVGCYQDLQDLSGYTSMVSALEDVLTDLEGGTYERTLAKDGNYYRENGMAVSIEQAIREQSICKVKPAREDKYYSAKVTKASGGGKYVVKFTVSRAVESGVEAKHIITPRLGTVTEADHISFDNVMIVTPNGDPLIDRVTFKLPKVLEGSDIKANNVFVKGPNGCGKSSLFRMLGQLWPTWDGTLQRPRKRKDGSSPVFYIPQKPYLTRESLRDQIIYPDSGKEMKKKGVTDAYLWDLLVQVGLDEKFNHVKGDPDQIRKLLDSVQEWYDVLSGGEKQRLAMARLYYHAPDYAILDECTSACSKDIVYRLYDTCAKKGIQLMTISHHPEGMKYHRYMLKITPKDKNEFGSGVTDNLTTGTWSPGPAQYKWEFREMRDSDWMEYEQRND